MFGRDVPQSVHPGNPGERIWMCRICGWILREAEGDPARGVDPGTPVENYPSTWRCPKCRVPTKEFDPAVEPTD